MARIRHRGTVYIHAAKGWSDRGLADPRVARLAAARGVDLRDLPRGEIVAAAELVDTHEAHPGCCDSPWAETSYAINGGAIISPVAHLVLERIRQLADPVPWRGALGFWTVPPVVDAMVHLDLSVADARAAKASL